MFDTRLMAALYAVCLAAGLHCWRLPWAHPTYGDGSQPELVMDMRDDELAHLIGRSQANGAAMHVEACDVLVIRDEKYPAPRFGMREGVIRTLFLGALEGMDATHAPCDPRILVVSGHSAQGLLLGFSPRDFAITLARRVPDPMSVQLIVADTCEAARPDFAATLLAAFPSAIYAAADEILPAEGLDYARTDLLDTTLSALALETDNTCHGLRIFAGGRARSAQTTRLLAAGR